MIEQPFQTLESWVTYFNSVEIPILRQTRRRLEEARQKVKNLERKRGELELEMERARDILARQLSSFEDIEQTITQLDSTDVTPSGESGELLF